MWVLVYVATARTTDETEAGLEVYETLEMLGGSEAFFPRLCVFSVGYRVL